MILVDTSIWVDHFRRENGYLSERLGMAQALLHPLVLGEIACGHLPKRRETLHSLKRLPQAETVTDAEALHFLETHSIHGRGIGYLDVHLLASAAVMTGIRLWTRDKRLHTVASKLELAHEMI